MRGHRAVLKDHVLSVEPLLNLRTGCAEHCGHHLKSHSCGAKGVVEAVHLAEVIQSLLFLTNSEALTEADFTGLKKWFAEYFDWLNTSRLAGLARDNKNHHGTSWLLQAAAIAHLTQAADDAPLTTLRHQYKSSTIRAQILADGTFPRATPSK